jgi:hypothetical protein
MFEMPMDFALDQRAIAVQQELEDLEMFPV